MPFAPKYVKPKMVLDDPLERDTPMTATYVRVLLVEAVILGVLWFFGKLFS